MPATWVGFALGVQLFVIWRWRGVWRWLAAVPLMMMAAFVALIPALVSIEPELAGSWLQILELFIISSPTWLGLLGLTRLIIHCVTVF